jgi:hypothetical protein
VESRGENDLSLLRMSYLRSSAGYVLVADGSRAATLETVLSIRQRVEADHVPLSIALLLNHNDLRELCAIPNGDLEALCRSGCWLRSSSVRTGEGVEDAFTGTGRSRSGWGEGRRAETHEPEELLVLMREYHATLVPLIQSFEGTLDRFAGDGMMVFFNDPLPCTDLAARAVRLAVALREAAMALAAAWRRRGHQIGSGSASRMVLQIGFEGRSG